MAKNLSLERWNDFTNTAESGFGVWDHGQCIDWNPLKVPWSSCATRKTSPARKSFFSFPSHRHVRGTWTPHEAIWTVSHRQPRPRYVRAAAADPPPPRRAALYDLSQLLETGLDRETLAVLIGLTEQGVNPEV